MSCQYFSSFCFDPPLSPTHPVIISPGHDVVRDFWQQLVQHFCYTQTFISISEAPAASISTYSSFQVFIL